MKIFGSVSLGFFTCWTPLYVYLFLEILYPSIFIKDRCAVFVGLFYYIFLLLSTVVNPLILIAFSSNYRAALKDVFSALFPKCHSESESPIDRSVELHLRTQSMNVNKISPKSRTQFLSTLKATRIFGFQSQCFIKYYNQIKELKI